MTTFLDFFHFYVFQFSIFLAMRGTPTHTLELLRSLSMLPHTFGCFRRQTFNTWCSRSVYRNVLHERMRQPFPIALHVCNHARTAPGTCMHDPISLVAVDTSMFHFTGERCAVWMRRKNGCDAIPVWVSFSLQHGHEMFCENLENYFIFTNIGDNQETHFISTATIL